MCRNLVLEKMKKNQTATWLKGNEPEPIRMNVDVVPCACGKKFWATINGVTYVECEAPNQEEKQ